MSGIGIYQLLIILGIVAAVVYFGSYHQSSSVPVLKPISKGVRLVHWVLVALLSSSSAIVSSISISQLFGGGLVASMIFSIVCYEVVRSICRFNATIAAFFLAIPVITLLDIMFGATYFAFNEVTYGALSSIGGYFENLKFIDFWKILLVNATILVGIATFLIRIRISNIFTNRVTQDTPSASYGGLAVNDKKNEVNRYVMSNALLGGSLFRRDVINRATDKHNAVSNELGLDNISLLKACLYFESRENRFRLVFVGLTIMFFVAALMQSEVLLLLSVIGLIVTQITKSYQERFKLVREFQDRNFNSEDFLAKHNVSVDVDMYPGVYESKHQNVSIYRGFTPFEGAGLEMGSWSFAVDLSRSKENLGGTSKPESFGVYEIYGALDDGVIKLGIPNLTIEDHLFVNGADIEEIEDLLPDKYAKPRQYLDEKFIAPFQTKSDGIIRHYKWIKIYDWGNDLINSFFVRYEKRGDNLFLEASKYLLTPLDTRFRKLDRILPYTFMSNVAWVIGSVFLTIVSVISSIVFTYMNLMLKIGKVFGFRERAMRKLIRNSANYNYGAPISLRQKLCSPNFMHYFQRMDNDMYLKTLERQIIDSTVDFLDMHNVDISEIKERSSTILNSGVIVQGGDVKAQTLAVGKGAKAESKGFFSKVKGKQTA